MAGSTVACRSRMPGRWLDVAGTTERRRRLRPARRASRVRCPGLPRPTSRRGRGSGALEPGKGVVGLGLLDQQAAEILAGLDRRRISVECALENGHGLVVLAEVAQHAAKHPQRVRILWRKLAGTAGHRERLMGAPRPAEDLGQIEVGEGVIGDLLERLFETDAGIVVAIEGPQHAGPIAQDGYPRGGVFSGQGERPLEAGERFVVLVERPGARARGSGGPRRASAATRSRADRCQSRPRSARLVQRDGEVEQQGRIVRGEGGWPARRSAAPRRCARTRLRATASDESIAALGAGSARTPAVAGDGLVVLLEALERVAQVEAGLDVAGDERQHGLIAAARPPRARRAAGASRRG